MRQSAFLILVLSAALIARADVTPLIVEVPIDPAAVTGPGGDPALADFRTFDLRVFVDGGSRFNVAGMLIDLQQGSMYAPQGGADTPLNPMLSEMFPYLEYDTHVTVGDYGTGGSFVAIPGRLYGTGAAELPRFGEQKTRMNVAWGRYPSTSLQGEFTIARITLEADSVGSWEGRIIFNANQSKNFTAQMSDGAVVAFAVVPEPASVMLLAPAAIIFGSRSRRRV